MRARSMTTIETAPERATIPILQADQVQTVCDRALDQAREGLARIEAVPLESATTANILDAWDDVAMIIEDTFGPISLLNSVHPDKTLRDVTDDALVQESSYLTEVFQNEAFYERVRRVEPRSVAEKELQKQLLEAFEDSGVSLAPEK